MLRTPQAPAASRGLRGLAMLLAVTALVTLAGCDGGDGDRGGADRRQARTAETPATAPTGREASPAERAAIRKAVVRLFRTEDVEVICERALTPRLFRLIFAGPAACRKVTSEDDDDKEDPPDRVEVGDVEIIGHRATAVAKLIGGDTGGAEGILELRKGKGGWRTDDFSIAFLRSSVSASLDSERKIPAAVGRCIEGRLTGMPDPEFKRLALALIGEQREANVRLLEMLSECERRRGGVTSVRRELEKTVRRTLQRAGAGKGATACTLRRLRTTLPDRLLVRLATDKTRASRERITREVVAAAVACGARRRGGPGELSPA